MDRESMIEYALFLEREIGYAQDGAMHGELCRRYKLSPGHGKLLLALAKANGRALSMLQLMEATGARTDDTKTITVMVCQIRAKCGQSFIVTYPGVGYAIGKDAAAAIEAIRRELVQTKLAA